MVEMEHAALSYQILVEVLEPRIQGIRPHGLPTKHANFERQSGFDHSEVVVLNPMATFQTVQYVVLGIGLFVVLDIGLFVLIGIGLFVLIGIGPQVVIDIGLPVTLDIGLIVLLDIDLIVLLDIVLDQLVCGEGVGHHTVVC